MKVLQLNKRKIFLLWLPWAVLCFFTWSFLSHIVSPLADKVILIDAGHGGIDPGANRPGVLEKDINLSVALLLRDALHQQGARVVLSREIDMDLSSNCDDDKIKSRYKRDLNARLELVEEADVDIFISIHANSNSSSKRKGADSFYYADSVASEALANAIQIELQKITTAAHKAKPANYFVLRKNKVPATLIELGYITNADERKLLQSAEHQQKLADAIAKGICEYFRTSSIMKWRM
jgi:N-acetylmuramoyl-L-alanine amidase